MAKKKATKKTAEKKARPKQTKTAQQVLAEMGEPKQGTFPGTKSKSYGAAQRCIEAKDELEAARRHFNKQREKLGQVMTLDNTKVVQCGECTFTLEGKEIIKLTGYKQKTDK